MFLVQIFTGSSESIFINVHKIRNRMNKLDLLIPQELYLPLNRLALSVFIGKTLAHFGPLVHVLMTHDCTVGNFLWPFQSILLLFKSEIII